MEPWQWQWQDWRKDRSSFRVRHVLVQERVNVIKKIFAPWDYCILYYIITSAHHTIKITFHSTSTVLTHGLARACYHRWVTVLETRVVYIKNGFQKKKRQYDYLRNGMYESHSHF